LGTIIFYTIYKITNKINSKYYIGKHQTKDLNDGYMGSGKILKRAIEKHGLDNFTKEILFIFDNEEHMNAKEKELVVVSEETYNFCEGGKGGFGYINRNGINKRFKPQKEETKLKVSVGLKKYYDKNPNEAGRSIFFANKKCKEKYPNGVWKNKLHREETKSKIGNANKISQLGSKNSQFGTCWITDGKQNKKIKKEDIDKWFCLGYYKGRMLSNPTGVGTNQ
jgi:hypothetical protein